MNLHGPVRLSPIKAIKVRLTKTKSGQEAGLRTLLKQKNIHRVKFLLNLFLNNIALSKIYVSLKFV